ncbi:hypothetical protein L1987_72983 [Smallanthus sonchifolius]|uniref:Uncharacterized protein n=1 Tax=Smallanthus sonchifolius TaxID=185202 RepID=A0ACB9AXE8_9ASTR|nr:hypothetical protein L1987_72983 [Smallanthus sonchifolius]
MPVCPKSFACPALAPFKYPFYNATGTSCGLIKVNCTPQRGEIQIEGRAYVILEKFDSDSSVVIYNRTFNQLVQNKTCESLMDNFTSPSPLLYSILVDFITVFKCPNNIQQVHTYFDQFNYNSYNRCKDHSFYYKYLVGNATVPNDLPHTCEVIRLPVKQPWRFYKEKPDETNISSLLSSGFSISFQVSTSCNKCHKNGGRCNINNGYFLCLDPIKGTPTIKLILVLAGSSSIVVLSSVIFIIWCSRKSNPFSYVSSKNKSPDLEGSLFCGVSVFSYSELEDATRNFSPSHKLGDGGFGAVYYVLIELISSMVAVDFSRSRDEISLANIALNRIQKCEFDQLIDPVLGSDSNVEIKNMITSVAELAFRCLQFDSEMRPTMREVLDVLMEIQEEKRIDAGDNIRESKINDSVVLLKDFPPSPVSVTGEWRSDISASTTVSSNRGDGLPLKNHPYR